jgi:hypothetical protein
MHPNDGRVVSNFIIQALLGRDITVYGDGLQTRSFCFADDLIDGLITPPTNPRRADESPRSESAPTLPGNRRFLPMRASRFIFAGRKREIGFARQRTLMATISPPFGALPRENAPTPHCGQNR